MVASTSSTSPFGSGTAVAAPAGALNTSRELKEIRQIDLQVTIEVTLAT